MQRLLSGRSASRRPLICVLIALALLVRSDRMVSQSTAVGAWAFNEGTGTSAGDRTTYANTATLDGASWTTGKYGSGLAFDGIDDELTVADANSLDLSSAFTIEAWINPAVSVQARTLVRKEATSGFAYSLSLDADSKIQAKVTIDSVVYTVTGATTVLDSEWSHVATTYDGTNLRVWLNGDVDGTEAVTGEVVGTSELLGIGSTGGTTEWYAGLLDELRIYSVALTESQIEADSLESIDDLTPPTITASAPSSGTINVLPSADITITFSEPLDALTVDTGTFQLLDSGNNEVTVSVSYDSGTQTVTLNPTANLAELSAYTINVRGGGTAPVVKDVAGNSFASAASWSFATADVSAPTVVSANPTSGQRNVSLASALSVTFSEAMDPASVSTTTVQLLDTLNATVSGTVSYDAPTLTATFTPDAALQPTRTYTLSVAGGVSGTLVEDLAGNPLAAAYSTSFITTVEPTRIAAGATHSVAVDDTGQVWGWGSDSNGERGNNLDGRSPGIVTAGTSVVAVAAGDYHTLALKTDGTVIGWGRNVEGQVGNGNQVNQQTPVAVSTLTNVIAIAAGKQHSIALKSDGTVWAWGAAGVIGDGQSVRRLTPVQVSSLTDIIAIAAGNDHSLALKGDGTVWAWGLNAFGQLGDNSTTARLSPVQVSSLSGVIGIAAGDRHSLALLSDLTVKAWGGNDAGQLGDGTTTTPRLTPVTATGLSNVRSVEGGERRSFAALVDGTARMWGRISTGSNATTATGVPGTPPAWQIAAGYAHVLTVTADGVVSAAAYDSATLGQVGNSSGQIGNGTTVVPDAALALSDPAYLWRVGTPNFNVISGNYQVEKTVTVTVVTTGVTIHYTLNGVDPTESDPTVTSGGTVQIDQTRTLKAKAWKSGLPASGVAEATYTLNVANPVFSPSPSTYTSARTVSITSISPGATFRYTTDGSTPSETSTEYTAPIVIGTTTTLKAIGFRANWTASGVVSGLYTMNFGTLAAPTLDPEGGTFTSEAVVTMTAMTGASIRYTTNGSTPSESSALYTAPVSVTATQTLKARAFHPDYTASATTSAAYTIVVATPTLSPTAGSYPVGELITVSTATAGATLHYTLNGLEPTASDPIIASGGTLTAGNFTLKVNGWKTGATTSSTATATYELTGTLGVPRIAAGDSHSLAIRGDGVVFAWGNNSFGQLGVGTTSSQLLPALVSGVTGGSRVSGGTNFSLATTSDGESWGWGLNNRGQLGDDTTTYPRTLPVQTSALTGVTAVSAGGFHSLALKSDGTLTAWGYNTNGQIGDGTTTQRISPVVVSGLTNVTAAAAGDTFSLALESDGTVWSWGNNGNGQLGIGSTTSRSTPGSIPTLSNVTAIAAGSSHALAVLSDGTVRAWGTNTNGKLGDGTTAQRTAPVTVGSLSNITAVAAGENHSLALDASGVVWAWGSNANGAVGDGTTTNRLSPVTVSGLPSIAAIAAGGQHSLALGTDGSVWAWGRNNTGQLGDGTQTNRLSPVQIADADMAWKVAAPAFSVASGLSYASFSVTVTEADPAASVHYTTNGATPTEADPVIASGGTIAIDQTTTLKARAFKPAAVTSEVSTANYELKVVAPTLSPSSGNYGSAQTVTMSTTTPGASITYTVDGTEPTAQSSAYSSGITVSATQTVKARGYKTGWTASDAGLASYWLVAGTVATPTITPATGTYASLTLAQIACATSGATIRYSLDGSDPTLASPQYLYPLMLTGTVTLKARAFLPGYASSAVASATFTVDPSGQSSRPLISPAGGWFESQQAVTITAPMGATVRYTLTGVDPTTSDDEVPAGGLTIEHSALLKVRAWETGSAPSAVARADFAITGAIASGRTHVLALGADGVLWAWGGNGYGQVGDGTTTSRTTPYQVLTDVKAIAAGTYFSMALKNDGTVWTWGDNAGGQLGQGLGGLWATTPGQVSGLTNVISIAAGTRHALAVRDDGTVWAWGQNEAGEVGDGTTTKRSVPVQVTGLRAQSVAAGEAFSLALETEGAQGGVVWAWGTNDLGQLGDGSTLSRDVPIQIPLLQGVAQISAGRNFALARLNDGTVRAWGDNSNGTLAQGSTEAMAGVQQVRPLARIRSIAAGELHALAIDIDGHLWAWGNNQSLQLGSPNAFAGAQSRPTPQLVPQFPETLLASGGNLHSLVLRSDGSIWAVGSVSSLIANVGSLTLGLEMPNLMTGDQTSLTEDQDGDGLPTWRELTHGTDPLNVDTNGNGLNDLVEVDLSGAHPDEDGDGIASAAEVARGTDPFLADTDGDAVADDVDAFPLDSTRSEAPAPNPADTTPPVITLTEPTNAQPIN